MTDIKDFNGNTIGRISGNEIKDFYGNTIYRISNGEVRDTSGNTVYRISNDEVRDFSGNTVYRISNGEIKDFSGNTVYRTPDRQKPIEVTHTDKESVNYRSSPAIEKHPYTDLMEQIGSTVDSMYRNINTEDIFPGMDDNMPSAAEEARFNDISANAFERFYNAKGEFLNLQSAADCIKLGADFADIANQYRSLVNSFSKFAITDYFKKEVIPECESYRFKCDEKRAALDPSYAAQRAEERRLEAAAKRREEAERIRRQAEQTRLENEKKYRETLALLDKAKLEISGAGTAGVFSGADNTISHFTNLSNTFSGIAGTLRSLSGSFNVKAQIEECEKYFKQCEENRKLAEAKTRRKKVIFAVAYWAVFCVVWFVLPRRSLGNTTLPLIAAVMFFVLSIWTGARDHKISGIILGIIGGGIGGFIVLLIFYILFGLLPVPVNYVITTILAGIIGGIWYSVLKER